MTTDATVDVEGAPPTTGGRLPGALVISASVLAVLSAVTTWVRTDALNTERWVEASTELLAEPIVQQSVAEHLTEELFSRVDLAAVVESALPEELGGLAGPVTAALRGPATEAVERLLASGGIQELWAAANERAHALAVRVLRDELPRTSTADGVVALELNVVLAEVAERLGLSADVVERLPPDAGRIVIVEVEQLERLQSVVRILDVLSWFLFVLVAALYAGAVALARDRRRVVLRHVGIGLVASGVVVLAIRALLLRTGPDALVQDPRNRDVGQLAAEVWTELLRDIAWSGIVYGALVSALASLLGEHEWARAARRPLIRWAETPWAPAIATGAIVVALLWWRPGRAFDRWVTAVLLVALVAAANAALYLQVRSELRQSVEGGPEVEPATT